MTQYTLSLLPSLTRHDVVEVAGLTSFSFGEDDDCRYVMIFKKVKGLCSSLSSPLFSLSPLWERNRFRHLYGPLTPSFPSSPGVCTLR